MRFHWMLSLMAVTSGPAMASGGAACVSESGTAKIDIQAGVTTGMGSPIFSMTAKVDIPDDKAPADLRASTFGKDQLTQYWFDANDLRFVLYRERQGDGAFGSVEVTISTKPVGDEITYAGKYLVSIFDAEKGSEEPPATYEGAIKCTVE